MSWRLSKKEELLYRKATPVTSAKKLGDKTHQKHLHYHNEYIDDDERICRGCGVPFQTTDEKELGYIDSNILKSYIDAKNEHQIAVDENIRITNSAGEGLVITKDLLEIEKQVMGEVNGIEEATIKKPERVVCLRCYTLTVHNKVLPLYIPPSTFSESLKPIQNTKALIVMVVDILDFHGGFVGSIRKYVGNNPIMIAATKVDLLPYGAKHERIKQWVQSETKKFGIQPVHVELISGKTGVGVKQLADQIEWKRQGCDVFVVGCANAGKSTFINKLIDCFHGPNDRKLTVSRIPGTTLNFVSLPIGKSSFLYDTPGVVTTKQIFHHLSSKELKAVVPKKKMKPAVYRIGPGKSLFIAGLARIDYIDGPGLVYFTVFSSNELYVHKTSTHRADEVYDKNVGAMLSPPYKEALPTWQGLTDHGVFEVDNRKGTWDKAHNDIVLPGLGWISITQKGIIKIRVWYPFDCTVGLRDPLMPFESILGTRPNPRLNLKPYNKVR